MIIFFSKRKAFKSNSIIKNNILKYKIIQLFCFKKPVSAIPMGLKCETRYSCYSHLQRDSLIILSWKRFLS